ncbi:MAG: glycosyltransferase family 9 protein [Anaeromyxobacteraceae bacterium]
MAQDTPQTPGSPTRAEQVAAAKKLGGGVQRGPIANFFRAIGRTLALGLANLVFPRPRAALPALDRLRRVLVVRLDERVGNQLLTTPLLRALKLGLPGAELHLLAPKQGRLAGSPHVDRFVLWQKRDAFKAPLRFIGLLRGLRRERYDLVVEANHWSAYSLTGSLVARLVAGKAPIVGHDRGDAARFLSHPVRHDPAEPSEVPAKLELLQALGLPARGLELETSLGVDALGEADALLAAAGLTGKPLAVVNPGARISDRRWPPEHYAEVCKGLIARGLAPLVVWGPGEEVLAKAIAEGSGAVFAPPTSLPLLAALMRRARLVVSNNSGPMHLAMAVGARTVGVFFRGDSARWGHRLPTFAAAEVRGDAPAEVVLRAVDEVMR